MLFAGWWIQETYFYVTEMSFVRHFIPKTQKYVCNIFWLQCGSEKSLRNFSARYSRARNGCSKFLGSWDFWALSLGKPHAHKISHFDFPSASPKPHPSKPHPCNMPQAKTNVALQFSECCAAETALQHRLFCNAEVIWTRSCAAANEKLHCNIAKAALQESGAFLDIWFFFGGGGSANFILLARGFSD